MKSGFLAAAAAWDTVKGHVGDGRVLEEMNGWVTNTEARVGDTLLDSEMFMDLRDTIEHKASADPLVGPIGSDALLQEERTAGSILTGLDGLLETNRALTQALGDAEDQIKLTIRPDDAPKIIKSAEESDLRVAQSGGHLKEERVTTGEEGTGNRGLL